MNEDRLGQIEQRLTKIESFLGISDKPLPKPQPLPKPKPEIHTPVVPSGPGNWLGIVAVICFVLAAGFIIKLSIDSGWLTPLRQVIIAALFGFSLIGAGFVMMRADREYASLLPGAGVIVLYLTAFAAHRYYDLIGFEAALGLTSLVSALCIWLYVRVRHDVYAITAALGAYLSPVILNMHAAGDFSLFYYLLCSAAFATISVWVESRMLTLVSSYLAIMMTGLLSTTLDDHMMVAVALALHFLIFSIGTYRYTTQNQQPLTQTEAGYFLPVLLLFYAMEYQCIERVYPGIAPWISLGFAGVLIALYLAAKRWFPTGLGSQTLIVSFATVVAFHSVYLELLPSHMRPWLFVIFMLGYAFTPLSTTQRKGAFFLPFLAVMAIVLNEYFTLLMHLVAGDMSGNWMIMTLAAITAMWSVLIAKPSRDGFGQALLTGAHLLAITALYRLTSDIGSLAVSASWLFYAVAVMVFAFVRGDAIMAKSALFVLGFAAAKALLYDAASAPTIVRILCLLLTGVVLYGSGFLMRKIAEWTK